MKYANVDGLIVSRLVLGTGYFGTQMNDDLSAQMLTRYIEAGGNMVDSGHVYADWVPGVERSTSEKCLGRLFKKNPDLRKKILVSTKGAHYDVLSSEYVSRVRPDCIKEDIDGSLQCLNTDFIDFYWLHRDDPKYPVQPIMDELFDAQDSGKIGHIGASNWTNERIDEANKYASQVGRKGFVANQISFAYAKNLEPGGVGAEPDTTMLYFREPEDIEYYRQHKELTIFSYTSQANGYISKILNNKPLSEFVRRVYDCPTNRARAHRAGKLAEKYGVSPEAIGLEYQYTRGFEVCTVIGPRSMEQLNDTLTAADFIMSEDDIKYLETDE